MEEKERYKHINISENGYEDVNYICDKLLNKSYYHEEEYYDLLNQQDKRIRELEDKDWYEQCIKQLEEQNTRLLQEIQQLKQSQKELTISKLEEVYEVVKDYNSEANKYEPYIDTLDIEQYIDDKIKELKQPKVVTNEYDNATKQECLDELNFLTDDLSWEYQLDDLDKLISKAQDIENIAKRLKELKVEE